MARMANQVKRKYRVARIATIPETFSHLINNIIDYQNNGFEVDLICSYGPFGDFLQKEYGFNIIYLEIPRNISFRRDIKSLLSLARVFWKNNYDIIHSHTPKAGLLTALAGLLSFRRIRLHTFTGQRWVTLPQNLRRLLRTIERSIIFLNTRCYADSHSQIDFLVEEKIAKKNQLKCLVNGSYGGIDANKFTGEGREKSRAEISEKFNIPKDQTWGLFVGRVVHDKGISEIVRAHLRVIKDKSYQLILVGNFEDELDPVAPEIKEIILSCPSIHHLGFQKDPASFMRAADFLCLPSYREGFGSVVIEAAACGTPAIVTDIPGLKDAIEDGKTGLMVPLKDVTRITESIHFMIDRPADRLRMGQAAQKRARECFDYKLISQAQMEEYRELLK
jgi:glycosyltransferase involved in cell wall biosynthesis